MLNYLTRSPDGQAGLFFIGFGGIVAWQAAGYDIGTAARMGPGFFPFALGLILVALGLAVLLTGWRKAEAEETGAFQARAVFFITLSVVVGGVVLTRFGLAPAVIAATFIAAFAEPRATWLRVGLVSILLVGFAWLVFIYGLNLRLPLMRI